MLRDPPNFFFDILSRVPMEIEMGTDRDTTFSSISALYNGPKYRSTQH